MPAATQSTFKIVQLNAENLFLYMDHYDNQDLKTLSEREWQNLSTSSVSNKPLNKTRWLAESLNELNPDVVVLNEVGGLESLENFNAHFLDSRFHVHLIEGNSDRGIDVGYLVHRQLPCQSLLFSHKNRPLHFNYPHERIWNAQYKDDPEKKTYPSHRFSRDILELRLFDENTNKIHMIFLACHLKSKLDREGIDPKGTDRRRAEFETLLKIYDEVRSETGQQVPVLMAGDFNGQARWSDPDPEFESIQSKDVKDAFDLIDLEPHQRFTRFDVRNGQSPEGQQIDYVFLSPELQDQLVADQCYVYRYKGDLGVELPPIQTPPSNSPCPQITTPLS